VKAEWARAMAACYLILASCAPSATAPHILVRAPEEWINRRVRLEVFLEQHGRPGEYFLVAGKRNDFPVLTIYYGHLVPQLRQAIQDLPLHALLWMEGVVIPDGQGIALRLEQIEVLAPRKDLLPRP
jgi:hypothetical protein